MKESRFIELLNLYIDQQISPGEAVELESEIARSPAHRRTYLQYCRMHCACTRLFEDFHAPAAPLAQALSRVDGKIERQAPLRRHPLAFITLGGGLAAAACVAFVVATRSVEKNNALPQAVSVAAIPAVETPPAGQPKFQTVFSGDKFSLAANRAAIDAQQAAFDWMKQIQLSPLAKEGNNEIVFGPQSESSASDLRFQRTHGVQAPAAEMTAFEFQK